MVNRLFGVLTSLRLTVICLGCAMVLVVVGTLGQVDVGLYVAQEKYFRSLFIFWTPKGTDWRIPVFPGGYLLGWVLLINLIAAHIKRFEMSKKKFGIFLTHAGLILLLVGQFLTEVFQVESFLRFAEGESKNYTENSRRNELVVIDMTDPKEDVVISIPESSAAQGGEIQHPALPFKLRMKDYTLNSEPALRGPMVSPAPAGAQGVAQKLEFKPIAPTYKMDAENIPSVNVEVVAGEQSLGVWSVSNWLNKHPWNAELNRQLGPRMGGPVGPLQTFEHAGRKYGLAFRPERYYKPYSLQLVDFTHDRYKGTEIPKNFSSKVKLENPANGETREVLIYMNNPLRYGGETYYQGGFEPGDTTSILQVVRNPAWLGPYIACILVGAGLTVQFLMHLTQFGRRIAARQGAAAGAAAGKQRRAQVAPATKPQEI